MIFLQIWWTLLFLGATSGDPTKKRGVNSVQLRKFHEAFSKARHQLHGIKETYNRLEDPEYLRYRRESVDDILEDLQQVTDDGATVKSAADQWYRQFLARQAIDNKKTKRSHRHKIKHRRRIPNYQATSSNNLKEDTLSMKAKHHASKSIKYPTPLDMKFKHLQNILHESDALEQNAETNNEIKTVSTEQLNKALENLESSDSDGYEKVNEKTKNSLSHEADYKLSKFEQDAAEMKRKHGKWPKYRMMDKRSGNGFNAMNEIKLKTSSRLMSKGFGPSLPSNSLEDTRRDLIIDDLIKRKEKDIELNNDKEEQAFNNYNSIYELNRNDNNDDRNKYEFELSANDLYKLNPSDLKDYMPINSIAEEEEQSNIFMRPKRLSTGERVQLNKANKVENAAQVSINAEVQAPNTVEKQYKDSKLEDDVKSDVANVKEKITEQLNKLDGTDSIKNDESELKSGQKNAKLDNDANLLGEVKSDAALKINDGKTSFESVSNALVHEKTDDVSPSITDNESSKLVQKVKTDIDEKERQKRNIHKQNYALKYLKHPRHHRHKHDIVVDMELNKNEPDLDTFVGNKFKKPNICRLTSIKSSQRKKRYIDTEMELYKNSRDFDTFERNEDENYNLRVRRSLDDQNRTHKRHRRSIIDTSGNHTIIKRNANQLDQMEDHNANNRQIYRKLDPGLINLDNSYILGNIDGKDVDFNMALQGTNEFETSLKSQLENGPNENTNTVNNKPNVSPNTNSNANANANPNNNRMNNQKKNGLSYSDYLNDIGSVLFIGNSKNNNNNNANNVENRNMNNQNKQQIIPLNSNNSAVQDKNTLSKLQNDILNNATLQTISQFIKPKLSVADPCMPLDAKSSQQSQTQPSQVPQAPQAPQPPQPPQAPQPPQPPQAPQAQQSPGPNSEPTAATQITSNNVTFGNDDSNNVKLNIMINANLSGDPKTKKFHGNSLINVQPGMHGERSTRQIWKFFPDNKNQEYEMTKVKKCDKMSESFIKKPKKGRKNLAKKKEKLDLDDDVDDEETKDRIFQEKTDGCKQKEKCSEESPAAVATSIDKIISGKMSAGIVKSVMNAISKDTSMTPLWYDLQPNCCYYNQQQKQQQQQNQKLISCGTKKNELSVKMTETMLKKTMNNINDIIEAQVRKNICFSLSPQLQDFYELILRTHAEQKNVRNKRQSYLYGLADNFSHDLRSIDANKIDQKSRIVKKLLKQYDELPVADQIQVSKIRNELLMDLIYLRRLSENYSRLRRTSKFNEFVKNTRSDDAAIKQLEGEYSSRFLKLLKVAEIFRDSTLTEEEE